MTQEHTVFSIGESMTTLKSWAHAVIPVGTEAFEGVALFSLACYLLFAVIALHYALQAWAEKAMLTSIAGATAASLLLHFSILHSPAYVGEGALWKFVSMSQYLPGAVVSLSGVYLLYRVGSSLLQRRR